MFCQCIRNIILILFVAPLSTVAQAEQSQGIKGINWARDLSWSQIKEKAKKENKYIFVDCFTTWCGPCKKMDEEVYTSSLVGAYMNTNFISVKLQMNRTNKDDESVKNWYADAQLIDQQLKIGVYPTYLFFAPNGQIVHRATSFQKPDQFIAIAKMATNPKEQFYALLSQYDKGQKDYALLPYMIGVAEKSGDLQLFKKLNDDYINYLLNLPEKELYSKERIEVIAANVSDTKSRLFKLFYPDGSKVNKIMKQSGYAWRTVNDIITREIFGSIGKLDHNTAEPDWERLHKLIKKRFGQRHADAVILWRKCRWHESDADKKIHLKCLEELIEKNGLDTTYVGHDATINGICYVEIFGLSTDSILIRKALNWMKGVVRRSESIEPGWDAESRANYKETVIDTYACLLYKAGKKNEAITWEGKALQLAIEWHNKNDVNDFQDKLIKMKNGERFWELNFPGK